MQSLPFIALLYHYVHKPAHVLKLLSVPALVMLYRLYTDQWNRV